MRFRQVHLDFHTSEAIPGVGAQFDKAQFQDMLKRGHVDSITVFSKCHHGWAYHPSEANEIHPHLEFDLLGAQIEAAHAVDVKTPVYISAGLDEKEARRRPEWLIRDAGDNTNWADTWLKAGYHQFCMNTPYLDVLVKQIEEVVTHYDADGIFLDIVGVRTCLCHTCRAQLATEGHDPRDADAVLDLGERVYAEYARRCNEAVHKHKPGLPVFHNGGHIRRGRRDLAQMNTHLELESLPTGGWGYDHFPLSARYAQTLGMDFLGMTGKFHTSWGEFGGYKHPNALRYEAALSLANGAQVSIGDHLHPGGRMDPATYSLIGAAYAEVEARESWCAGATNIADVGLLSLEAVELHRATAQGQMAKTGLSDGGAVRMLLEGHVLFDVIDADADFSHYKVLILPDGVRLSADLKAKLDAFFAQGGKVLATGESGLNEAGNAFALDFGVTWLGASEYSPEYFHPHFDVGPLGEASFVFYAPGQKVSLAGGTVLGHREEPYFNRDALHFCSHQHTPGDGKDAGPGMVEGPHGIYFGWNVFEDYATKGSLALKLCVRHALGRLLPEPTLETDLPAQGVVTLTEQAHERRCVNHLLYASPVKRGNGVEVIEDILPLHGVQVALRLPRPVSRVSLAPQGDEMAFTQENGVVRYVVPRLECHQMVVLEH